MRYLLLALFSLLSPLVSAATTDLKPLVIDPNTGRTTNLPAGYGVLTNAATTTNPSINLPHGTAPTSPTNGDMWTTTAGLFAYINGGTVGPFSAGSSSLTSTYVGVGNGSNLLSGSARLTYVENAGIFTLALNPNNPGGTNPGTPGYVSMEANGANGNYTQYLNIGSGNPASIDHGATVGIGFQTGDKHFGVWMNKAFTYGWTRVWDISDTTLGTTFSGSLTLPASVSGGANFNLPQGATPTTPNNGDIWTTSAGVFAQINGSTVGPFAAAGGGITGTLVSGRVPFANGTSSITDSGQMTFSTAHGLSVNRAIAGGARNEFIGLDAGNTTATGTDNQAQGNAALASISSGVKNVAIGTQALNANDAGSNNVAIGYQALMTGSGGGHAFNIGIGQAALVNNAASNNTAIGNTAMATGVVSGGHNTAIGNNAYNQATSGTNNTAIGDSAMQNYQTATGQVAIGYQALQGNGTPANNTGTKNHAEGYQALNANSSGSNNTAVGYNASLVQTSQSNDTTVGYLAGSALTTGGGANTFVGANAGLNATTMSNGTFVGQGAGQRMLSGTANTAVGNSALLGSATPASNTGANNAVLGTSFGQQLTSGSRNMVVGNSSGGSVTTASDNVLIGDSTASGLATGTGNIFLGSGAGDSSGDSTGHFVAGSATSGAGITQVYFGKGETATAPPSVTIQNTGGSGTNVAGGDLTLSASPGTGTGGGGRFIVNTAPAGTTGTTANTPTNALVIGNSQVATFPGTTDSTSVSTGTVVVGGGLGVTKSSYLGDTTNTSFVGNIIAGVRSGAGQTAGQVGEFQTATFNGGVGGTGTTINIQSLTLTRGCWLIWAQCEITSGTTGLTGGSQIKWTLSTTSGSDGSPGSTAAFQAVPGTTIASVDWWIISPYQVVNISSNTNYFANLGITYGGGSPGAIGAINAVRIR